MNLSLVCRKNQLTCDRSDCGVHIDSVSIDSCSLGLICAEQWHPAVIPVNRVRRSMHCAWKFPWVSRKNQLTCDRSDCRVHIDSVSIVKCSLRPICAVQWRSTVILLNRIGRSLHSACRMPGLCRNKEVVISLVEYLKIWITCEK